MSRIFECIPASALILVLSGCGYIGEPLPPLLNIPQRVGDLAAFQLGPRIWVRFTLPKLTTEGVVLKQVPRMDLRIGPQPGAEFNAQAWAATAQPVPGGAVANGVADYQIPAAEWVGKQVALAVKMIGKNGRDAGWSNPATLTVVPPPAQPHDLIATAVPEGVHLTWQGAGNAFTVFRRGPEEKEFQALARSEKPAWTDTTAQFGSPYSYRVQALVKAGKGEAESELSGEVTITPQDTFPPPPPTGLTAVPSAASIELAWQPEAGATIAGYRVYRALDNGPLQQIAGTQNLPAYSDRQIQSGKTYRYAVTTVKKNGMESKPSAPVEATAP